MTLRQAMTSRRAAAGAAGWLAAVLLAGTAPAQTALKLSLDGETAKKVAAAIKDAKLKKVQAAIQGDQVRVTSPSRDDLQEAIALLRGKDFGVELKFGNYR